MKRSTVIVLAVVFGAGLLVFVMMQSTHLPTSTSTAPTSTIASIFQFGTKALDATEKALPKFFDSTPDVNDASLSSFSSSAGFASHDDT